MAAEGLKRQRRHPERLFSGTGRRRGAELARRCEVARRLRQAQPDV